MTFPFHLWTSFPFICTITWAEGSDQCTQGRLLTATFPLIIIYLIITNVICARYWEFVQSHTVTEVSLFIIKLPRNSILNVRYTFSRLTHTRTRTFAHTHTDILTHRSISLYIKCGTLPSLLLIPLQIFSRTTTYFLKTPLIAAT